ncbi:DUF58 domain-containing protein [Pseudidiomarina sediminum]|uniref:DUF58 domain-containing protein n=1 Tax=Pseudidiomarina sediminum TaxID=431675 RepID=A0A432Z8S4_9GAMM|nr:DUF58 domain-containing protein [Pseudidiomarina sediminum]RUO74307.1 DUF58 domain-containing protein [Pseudidiomarina sediminum]
MSLASTTTATDWLALWQSDGVHVGTAELMYYRSKVAAFAQHRRLHPPQAQSGAILSKTRGRGMEFDEVRHYQAGDDVRAIDWRVTARTGSPHTKLFREERERPILFVVDLSPTTHVGSQLLLKSVQLCHITAALAWQATQRGDRVGAIIGYNARHIEVRPQARQHGVLRILHQLVELQNESLQQWQSHAVLQTDTLNELLRRAQQVAKPGTIVHVLSDWQHTNADTFNTIQALQRHCSMQAIQCSDPLEHKIPDCLRAENIAMTDHQQSCYFAAGDTAQRQRYAQLAQQQQQQLQRQLKQLNLRLRHFSAAIALEEQWPEVMR